MLVILQRKNILTSCPFNAVAAAHKAFCAAIPPYAQIKRRVAFSSAIMCKPIKAHAFTVSAEMQGPNSIHSPRTIGSSFRRKKKKSSPCGSYLLGTFWRLCANARCPTDPKKAKSPPRPVCPTSLAPCLSLLGHRPLTANFTKSLEPTVSLILLLLKLQSFVQCFNRVFEVPSPQLLPSLISSHCCRCVKRFSTISCRLFLPQGLHFLTFIWLPHSRCLTHFFVFFFAPMLQLYVQSGSKKARLAGAARRPGTGHFFVVIVQFAPFAAFNSFVDRLLKGMPISVHHGRSPPILRNVTDIDTRFLGANFLCPHCQFLGLTPRDTPLRTLAFVPQKALYLHSNGSRPRHSDYQL